MVKNRLTICKKKKRTINVPLIQSIGWLEVSEAKLYDFEKGHALTCSISFQGHLLEESYTGDLGDFYSFAASGRKKDTYSSNSSLCLVNNR